MKMSQFQVETEHNFDILKAWNKTEFVLHANILAIKINKYFPQFDC